MTLDEFEALVVAVLGERRRPNPRQLACITADLNRPAFIVAGPGTGKTSVLVLRALRQVLVDRIRPENILITTFTVKAAKEIRTRLLEWGEPLIARALADAQRVDREYAQFLTLADANRFITGTLDGVCQEALREQREPGERRYVIVEKFAADVLLSRIGEVAAEINAVGELNDYLAQYTMFGQPPRNTGQRVRAIRTIVDRFVQDVMDVDAYTNAPGPFAAARAAIRRIYDRYVTHMMAEHRMDFALLEQHFLNRVREGRVPPNVSGVQAILVDEYQDTNPLQERLYLETTRACGATLTVVGDDDQSLYRFRGATIELFRAFRDRALDILGTDCGDPLYLVENYRSSPEIVNYYNRFIINDPDFSPARIQPPKPAIQATRPSQNMPVLGIFRPNADQLADALSQFLRGIFCDGGRPADEALPEAILPGQNGGIGDAVFIGSTVAEFTTNGRERLPSLLRQRLEAHDLGCFNPRGRALPDVPEVQQLLGLVLMCLEPGPNGLSINGRRDQMRITQAACQRMAIWRAAAERLLNLNPAPVRGRTIREVMQRWQDFAINGGGAAAEWPILDVFYAFVPWLPGFRDDPEGQVYLEAISRCAGQAASFSPYRGLLLREPPHRDRSIATAVRDVLAPIAEDLIEVDEDIMPNVPRNMLNMMTIHQAKGLEFPLTIVDVASDYLRNNHMQAFRRFPRVASAPARLEDDLAPFTPIGPLRLARNQMQRSFEDIIRLHYVAYSRPQSVLVLVGCLPNLHAGSNIKNIALDWRRDESWAWRDPARPMDALANNIPLRLI